jgi:hypothetical protein
MKGKSILHYTNHGLSLLMKRLSISFLFFNNVGLKAFNPKLEPIEVHKYQTNYFSLHRDKKLYLLPDFLYDNYSLINKTIAESPHFELMSLLLHKKPIIHSDYVKRVKNGTLDLRPSYNFTTKFYLSIFERRKKEWEDNKLKPILVTQIKDRYYVLDGKHRASLLKVMNKPIPCICLEDFDIWEYYEVLWKKIENKNSKNFSKHFAFLRENIK